MIEHPVSPSQTTRKKSILDIPLGWGATPREFKAKVIQIIEQWSIGTPAPIRTIMNTDGSISSFHPVLCAISPEWGVITKEELTTLLYAKIRGRAYTARILATRGYADHISGMEEYLAWGLEQRLFSYNEIRRIRFDHGDTEESYIRDYGNPKLMEDTINQLVHPFSPVSLAPSLSLVRPLSLVVNKTSEQVDKYCSFHS